MKNTEQWDTASLPGLRLEQVPFSTRGSYMAISRLGDSFQGQPVRPGLYFRTVHGSASTSLVARVTPMANGKPADYTYEALPHQLTISSGRSCAKIAFYDPDTLLIGGDLALELDFLPLGVPAAYTFAQPYRHGDREFYLVNAFANNCRYFLRAQQGALALNQRWEESGARYVKIICQPQGETPYLVSLEECFEDWFDRGLEFDLEQAAQKKKQEFCAFAWSLPGVPQEYRQGGLVAAYVDWSGMVKPCGILKRESMFMSKNWMCNVWSWDHCFNAIALSYHNPKEAWDQFMVMFDFQKTSGNIPDSVNDCKIVHNYCKPPIHGWALSRMMEHMELSPSQLQEAYEKLGKWTGWWLSCRDENGDGLCEYTHGNDSGWDNATAFRMLPPTTTPDLAAFLVIQMEVLSRLAGMLAREEESRMWAGRSREMLEKMLQRLFVEGRPAAFSGLEMERVENDSLILYLPILLGERLPQPIRENLVRAIKDEGFSTPYGLATENVNSPLYQPDGYWRGPIWAPSTMLLLDGMARCGEWEFVRETARKFCEMVTKSGCAENFDALTGEGLRDRAYTWTASAMLVMGQEYLCQ